MSVVPASVFVEVVVVIVLVERRRRRKEADSDNADRMEAASDGVTAVETPVYKLVRSCDGNRRPPPLGNEATIGRILGPHRSAGLP